MSGELDLGAGLPGGAGLLRGTGLLRGVRFYQLHSAPRRVLEPEQPDPAPAQLFAALTAAHAELAAAPGGTGRLVVAWERRAGDPRLRVLLGGYPDFPAVVTDGSGGAGRAGAVGELVPVLYPPGSRARPVQTGPVLASWRERPAWIRCTGRPDALWNPDGPVARRPARGGFDDYVAHLGDTFVWLTIASPLPVEQVDEELAELDVRIPRLRRQENLESSRVALQRAESRFAELSRARDAGIWSVHVLVAGGSPASARSVAALLCGATDLDDLPYTLAPAGPVTSFTEAIEAVPSGASGEVPFPATTELLAALARPPKRELPGIHLVEHAEFDLTAEISGPVTLGGILDDADQPAGTFTVSTDTLNRHTFVAGATGAGKSQTVRHVLEQLHGAGIPWLVIEPAKAEYARMAGRVGDDRVTVIRPGEPDAPPVGLNPLEPEPGFPMQTHIDLVRALFLAAFEAEEPFPQVLHKALTQCYLDLGWDPVLGESRIAGVTPRHPSLGDLQRAALDVVAGIGYGREITDNVRGFIDVRIGSLRLGTPGRFFEGGHALDVADLLRHNVVLEIEDLGNDQDKAFLIGAVLIRVYEHLRTRHAATRAQLGLRHIMVIEEAHRLLKCVEPGSPAAHAVELFTALLAEIRAYGEGIVIAEQIPTKIVPDIVKNTALKIIHRLPAADDRELLGAAMNLDDAQSRHVVSLPPGRAVVFADGMDRPMRIEVPLGEARERAGAGRRAAIARTRGVTCGRLCRTSACLLREINYAGRLADDPRLILWIELLAAAHIVGRPSPRPDKAWLDRFADGVERRILECAIGHRVQAAIDGRYDGLLHYYQPESFAEHLVSVAMAYLDDGIEPCDGSEVRWQAGRYRWIDVLAALRAAPDLDHPHPDTEAWARRGLRLAGGTSAEQLDALRGHPDCWLPAPTIATGAGSPCAVNSAAARLSPAPAARQRLLEATGFLHLRTTWAASVFAAGDARDIEEGQTP